MKDGPGKGRTNKLWQASSDPSPPGDKALTARDSTGRCGVRDRDDELDECIDSEPEGWSQRAERARTGSGRSPRPLVPVGERPEPLAGIEATHPSAGRSPTEGRGIPGGGGAVSVAFAVGAEACGALGCTESSPLYRVRRSDGLERVLCPIHAGRWAE